MMASFRSLLHLGILAAILGAGSIATATLSEARHGIESSGSSGHSQGMSHGSGMGMAMGMGNDAGGHNSGGDMHGMHPGHGHILNPFDPRAPLLRNNMGGGSGSSYSGSYATYGESYGCAYPYQLAYRGRNGMPVCTMQ
ncbi:hypothetical protein [Kaistia adipata]|uniref:hypothetical protein n=1 Tax=Kaistia adipata TaxID=166954 RepID=UPI000490B215|nr:hypothetical protein [Kaistia adipata]